MTGLPKWSTLINQINDAVNIATENRTNIMIDVLTQGAYTERRTTLSNHGATALSAYIGAGNRIGKFFPRGCRGFIKDIELYCSCTDVEDGEFSLYLAPYPSAGYLYTADIELTNPTALAWQSTDFNIFWNYDSLFIFMKSEEDSMLFRYDAEENLDGYQSANAGATYTNWANRLWLKANYLGQTIGDIPVTGTINTINIPNTFTGHGEGQTVEIDGGSSVVLLDYVYGMGSLDVLMLNVYKTAGSTDQHDMEVRITIDGVVHEFNIGTQALVMNHVALSPSPITFTLVDQSNDIYAITFNVKMVYRQHLKIDLYNIANIGNKMQAYYSYVYSTLR